MDRARDFWLFLRANGVDARLDLALERLWLEFKPKFLPALPKIIGIAIIFHVVLLGWIFFRSQTFDEAVQFLSGMTHAGAPIELTVTPFFVALIVIGLAMHGLPERALDWMAAPTKADGGNQ